MKIDNSIETSKDNILPNYTIEASLFDTASWYSTDGYADLASSNVASLKLNPSPSTSLGFHGYWLEGRLEMPRLWSAEQVRTLHLFFHFVSSCLVLKLKADHFKLYIPFYLLVFIE